MEYCAHALVPLLWKVDTLQLVTLLFQGEQKRAHRMKVYVVEILSARKKRLCQMSLGRFYDIQNQG